MPIDLYYLALSAPCRAVMLTAKAVGVDLNLKKVDLFAGDHLKPEFMAINPQHCIPTMVDGDLKMWESRAICSYLVSKYGSGDSLYPTDPTARAKVDSLLYFDMGTLSSRFINYIVPIIFQGKQADTEQLKKVHEALGWLNGYLDGHTWAAGNTVTVADHTLVAWVSTMEAGDIDLPKYPNVTAWLERCKTQMDGYQELNQEGATEWGKMFKSKLQ